MSGERAAFVSSFRAYRPTGQAAPKLPSFDEFLGGVFVSNNPEYDVVLSITREESRALSEQSKVLRKRAADALVMSRRLREQCADFTDRIAEFLRLARP